MRTDGIVCMASAALMMEGARLESCLPALSALAIGTLRIEGRARIGRWHFVVVARNGRRFRSACRRTR